MLQLRILHKHARQCSTTRWRRAILGPCERIDIVKFPPWWPRLSRTSFFLRSRLDHLSKKSRLLRKSPIPPRIRPSISIRRPLRSKTHPKRRRLSPRARPRNRLHRARRERRLRRPLHCPRPKKNPKKRNQKSPRNRRSPRPPQRPRITRPNQRRPRLRRTNTVLCPLPAEQELWVCLVCRGHCGRFRASFLPRMSPNPLRPPSAQRPSCRVTSPHASFRARFIRATKHSGSKSPEPASWPRPLPMPCEIRH